MAWPFPAVVFTYSVFPTSSPYLDTNTIFKTYNSFWGLVYIKTKNANNFTCSSSLVVDTSITGVTIEQTAQWTGVLLTLKYCPSTNPYYLTSQDKCYDICPNLYYEDTTDMLCKLCTNTDCQKCSMSGACTTCDASRTLNGGTGRCDPKAGYF